MDKLREIMKTVLITGSNGFIGKNLAAALFRHADIIVACFDIDDDPACLAGLLKEADIIFHLAGVNRPQHEDEFRFGNVGLTQTIISQLVEDNKKTPIIITSSTQAELDNPYGISKLQAEDAVFAYGNKTCSPVYVYRLTNVFGKWSRPNYNSVVSTFCHNIANGLPITISNPNHLVDLVYIDDVISAFLEILDGRTPASSTYLTVGPIYTISLEELAGKVHQLSDVRRTLVVPDLSDEFTRKLHATFLSYLAKDQFSYPLDIKTDNRGSLAELIKSEKFGQMFVSSTHCGITRGNHYHDTKIEKFCVLKGQAAIRFRHIFSDEVIEYPVSGAKWEVVDIPPGYTHN